MTLKELKQALSQTKTVRVALPNGRLIPEYFHVTEMGKIQKHFIDCGNTIRTEEKISFQIWHAQDYDHRLSPEKFLSIIKASEKLIDNEDLPIVVEYQTDLSLSYFGLTFENEVFQLTPIEATCLANDHCGIPEEKMKISLKDLQNNSSCCTLESGCC